MNLMTIVMHMKFVLGRKLESLLLLNPGMDHSVTAAKVSSAY